jgi:hypothetical protein
MRTKKLLLATGVLVTTLAACKGRRYANTKQPSYDEKQLDAGADDAPPADAGTDGEVQP